MAESTLDIPVIDITDTGHAIGDSLVQAAAKFGFVFVRDCGVDIPPEEINSIFMIVRSNMLNRIISYLPAFCNSLKSSLHLRLKRRFSARLLKM